MKTSPQLLIFDIDGTLASSAGLTRVAFDMAAYELYQVDDATRGIEPFGSTDKRIFRELLEINQIPYKNFQTEFERFTERYVPLLAQLLQESDRPFLYPGVRNLLERLKRTPDIHLALGTGNIEITALLKLQKHKVEKYFPAGGFGNDSESRQAILKIAVRRAQFHYRIPFPAKNVWIIGDTPYDIAAAQSIGAKCIGVATGVFDQENLSRREPTAVLKDLSDGDRFLALIKENSHHTVPASLRHRDE